MGENVAQVCNGIAPLARDKNLHLSVEGCGCTEWVEADARHLRRLWLILLDNAIKYTPPGGAVRITWRVASADSVVCEVRDSGIGIAESDIPFIFERFYRADKARRREESGAGLGLSIARWIVEAHRATIEVESGVGGGSVFRVTLSAIRTVRQSGAGVGLARTKPV